MRLRNTLHQLLEISNLIRGEGIGFKGHHISEKVCTPQHVACHDGRVCPLMTPIHGVAAKTSCRHFYTSNKTNQSTLTDEKSVEISGANTA